MQAVSPLRALVLMLGLSLTTMSTAQPPLTGPAQETPPPRDANGRVILGSAPGNVGSWEGFGTRPMLTFFDEIPRGSIIAYTPYEEILAMQERGEDIFPKIKLSEVPFQ